MASMSDTSTNFIRLSMFLKSMGWDAEIYTSTPVLNEVRLGQYHRARYLVNDDIIVEAYCFDKGPVGPEVTVSSLQHGRLLTIDSLILEHTVSAVEEVLAWADETSPCS